VTPQKIFAVCRDLCCLGLGIFGVAHQEITGHVNLDLLALYTVLLGTPGAVGLVQLLRGRLQVTVTTESESPSPPAPSQQRLS
jgi:hypothetical protein